jgi:hypothetical protein
MNAHASESFPAAMAKAKLIHSQEAESLRKEMRKAETLQIYLLFVLFTILGWNAAILAYTTGWFVLLDQG